MEERDERTEDIESADVEAHKRPTRLTDDEPEVEGYKRPTRLTGDDDEPDVEGHKRPTR